MGKREKERMCVHEEETMVLTEARERESCKMKELLLKQLKPTKSHLHSVPTDMRERSGVGHATVS